MAATTPDTQAENFGNETHDDCNDDARTQQNREGSPKVEGAKDNAQQRARDTESDRPPTRDSGTRNSA